MSRHSKRPPALLDHDGRPLKRAGTAFAAADARSQELALWTPTNYSADGALLPNRDRIAARVHDMARNDGWLSSGLQKNLDSVIGARFALSARPDWRFLGLTADWASEWSRQVEAHYRTYAEDPDYFCDAARGRSLVSLYGLMYRHRITDGEGLGLLRWLPRRGALYSTALQVIDPDRLSNPHGRGDDLRLRGGVELGELGEPLAYHIRSAHPGDVFGVQSGIRSIDWERVSRETPFGRRMVIHDFEADRASQTRGRSPVAPIVKKLRMLGNYDAAELQAAVVNAIFAAFIESPMDHENVGNALGDESSYMEEREAFHDGAALELNGIRIPRLYVGERMNMTTPTRPAVAFASFEQAALRNVAAALGISYEQLAMDWSQTNYSSARAALNEVWKFLTARRTTFAEQTARQVYAAWLEEAIDIGDIDLPPEAPDFREAKAAYTRCKFIGPGRGWVDPVKEAQGAQARMEIGVSTLQDEAAEQGHDWEEVLEQRKKEIDKMEELGIPKPSWAAMQGSTPTERPQENETNA